VWIAAVKFTRDFELQKNVGGYYGSIAYEGVDIGSLQFCEIEFYLEGDGAGNWIAKVWRDRVLKFDLTHSEAGIPSIASVRFRKYDDSVDAAVKGKIKGPMMIIYE
jgi:hypothetical protein